MRLASPEKTPLSPQTIPESWYADATEKIRGLEAEVVRLREALQTIVRIGETRDVQVAEAALASPDKPPEYG